jgi:DNA-binding transcriptional MerR regulator
MKTYTMSETAKLLNIPTRTIKQWEKELQSIFQIPRTKQGARILTDHEIHLLKTIQQLYSENKTKREIIDYFSAEKQSQTALKEDISPALELQEAILEGEIVEGNSPKKQFMRSLEHWKEDFLHEVHSELVKEVKKEISSHAEETVQTITSIISEAQTTVLEKIEQISKETKNELQQATTSVKQLHSNVHQLTENTTMKVAELAQSIEQERQLFIDQLELERQIYHEKIMERERAFRELVFQFREAAVSEEKKQKKWRRFFGTLFPR